MYSVHSACSSALAAVVCFSNIVKMAVCVAGATVVGCDRGDGGHDNACLPPHCSTQEPKLLMAP